MTTVVLIEDHKKIRAMIKEILEDASDFQVVGSAADGRVGYDLVLTLRPQVVIVDLGLWQFTGPALTQRLKTLIPEIAIIGIQHVWRISRLRGCWGRELMRVSTNSSLSRN